MKELEAAVRGIEKDGLVWGASKLVPVGFGIKKLQINLVIEDDKIGLDDLQEQIQEFEDYVQSTDIVSSAHCNFMNYPANSLTGCYAKAIKHTQTQYSFVLQVGHMISCHRGLLAFPATGHTGTGRSLMT
jgi:translation elongation factor EF-1beta